LSISIESGNERLRREVLQRDISDEIILNAFRILHEAGILIYTNAMVALPYTTPEDDIRTVEFCAKCKPADPHFSVFTPFRGTALGERCVREQLIDDAYPKCTVDYSILNCFSERQKRVQINLVHLGMYAVCFPFLKKLILKYLIYLPPNRFYLILYYLLKNYLGSKYIFPVRAGLLYKIRLAIRAFSVEVPVFKGKRNRTKPESKSTGQPVEHKESISV